VEGIVRRLGGGSSAEGASVVEYGLLLAAVAAAVCAIALLLGGQIAAGFQSFCVESGSGCAATTNHPTVTYHSSAPASAASGSENDGATPLPLSLPVLALIVATGVAAVTGSRLVLDTAHRRSMIRGYAIEDAMDISHLIPTQRLEQVLSPRLPVVD